MTLQIVLLVILLLVASFFVVRCGGYARNMKAHSRLYIKTTILNNKYAPLFHILQEAYIAYYVCPSLQTFKNKNTKDSIANYLRDFMKERESEWGELYEKVENNRIKFNAYLKEYELLKNNLAGTSYIETKGKTFLTEKRYKKLEENICKNSLLKPIVRLDIICRISYTSPKGRSRYFAEWTVDITDVFAKIKGKKELEQSAKYQRALMTNSKRYDILKRDDYKCQLCGKTASDGAKLEIDHIIPVSRGGKTTDDNLQTLCRECNQGKKAKI